MLVGFGGIVYLFATLGVGGILYFINADKIIALCISGLGLIGLILLHKVLPESFRFLAQDTDGLKSDSQLLQVFSLGLILGGAGYSAYLYFLVTGGQKSLEKIKAPNQMEEEAQHPDNGTFIGTGQGGRPAILLDQQANQHVLVLGTTGSGKTVTISNIVESALNRGMPLIYIDGKGDAELAQRCCAYANQQGRPAWLFGLLDNSASYDPLDSGGFTSKKDRIIELREWSEAHYKKLAEGYLQAVFKVLDALAMPSDLITLSQHLDLRKLKSLVREHAQELDRPQALMDMLNEQDQAVSSISSLLAEIRNFTHSEIGHLFQQSDNRDMMTLKEVIRQQGMAYFCLPALGFPSLSQTLGRLIINDLKATMAHSLTHSSTPPSVYAIFDEFSVFAGEQVLNAINMGRSAGLHAVLSTQSLSDIASGRASNADHFINQVIGNCNSFILHRQNAPSDARMLAELIGTHIVSDYSAHVSHSQPGPSGTVRQVRAFLTNPDEIKSLGTGEAFYVSKLTHESRRIKARKGRV